jgi:hypothetical protein
MFVRYNRLIKKNLQFTPLQLGPLLALNVSLIAQSIEQKTSTWLLPPKSIDPCNLHSFPIISSNKARSPNPMI